MRCSGSVAALAAVLALTGCGGHRAPEALATASAGRAPDPAALAVLRSGAEDLDVEIRMKSLACLIRSDAEPAGGSWSPRALLDPSPYVQRAALEALAARIDEPAARAAVANTARRVGVDPYTRGLAGGILADAGEREASLSEAWRAAIAPWQAAPLALAAARMGDPEAAAAVGRALVEAEFPLEVPFFLSIGHSGLPELAPALRAAAGAVEEDLVLPLAVALLGLGAPEGEALLRQALAGPEEQRMEALDYLADLDGDAARRLVRGALAGGGPAARYARLVRVGWGEAPPQDALDTASDPDRELRALAVRALGRARHARPGRADGRVRAALAAALGDPEPLVRLEAIRALSLTGRPEDRGLLRPLLTPEGGRVDLISVETATALLCPGPS